MGCSNHNSAKISGKSNSDDRCDNAVKEKGGLKNNYVMVILLIAIVVLMANVLQPLIML